MSAVNDVRRELAEIIHTLEVQGQALYVTMDPRSIRAPCVLIDVPRLTRQPNLGRNNGCVTLGAEIPIRAIAPVLGTQDALAWLLEAVEQIFLNLDVVRQASPTTTTTDDGTPLPTLEMQVDRTVTL